MDLPAQHTALPVIIQGGMGVAVSSWRLANAVASRGQMGVVSGVALERVLVCRLQEGDAGGHLRRALAAFPDQATANRVLERYFRPDGLSAPGVYAPVPLFSLNPDADLVNLAICGAFTEIWLAKEGHSGPVGINMLEKIQLPTLPVLYGALLAGVDWVLMGAGIPKDIPRHLKALCQHQGADLNIQISEGTAVSPFIPPAWTVGLPPLRRPGFLAIISSDVLAASLARVDGVDGFIVEAPTAGGHNAPPRDKGAEPDGTPIYGPRDVPNLERLRKLGKPFWLAGGCASIERLAASQAEGAVGVQVGTAFAFCAESGMDPTIRRAAVKAVLAGTARIVTSGTASPTGFPFKVVEGPGVPVVGPRKRVTCSLGYLRSAYRKPDGAVGWRCPSEPEAQWIAKGGEPAATAGRTCVCHGLLSTIGHAHVHADGSFEGPLLTAGDALLELGDLFPADGSDYTAADVLERVLGR